LNFGLSDEQELIRRTVREFAETNVAPVAEELDREERFPYELVAELAELGLMGLPVPEEYGGAGGDTVSYAIAIEELTRIDSSVAITVAAHTSLGTMPILLFGDKEQKQEWLPRLASGRGLAAFGLTEPDAGSDAGATRTKAELRAGEWVIDGSKIFITNAGTDISACVTITARTGEEEISNLIVPNGTVGYEISAPMHKLGWRASDTRELSFRSCAVPEGNLLGERGRGFGQFMEILDGGRISVAAMGVGLAQGAYDLAAAYAKERQQFGKPIASFQAIQFQLADMATEIDAGRQLLYRAAWLKDAGKPFGPALEPRRQRRPPDPRRLRVHGGVRDRAPVPRPEDPRDRRGHERGAAHGDCAAPRSLAQSLPPLSAAGAVATPPPFHSSLASTPVTAAIAIALSGWRKPSGAHVQPSTARKNWMTSSTAITTLNCFRDRSTLAPKAIGTRMIPSRITRYPNAECGLKP
jgi:alkylation response protein AidB-like acyl-CoA dehydrogenase